MSFKKNSLKKTDFTKLIEGSNVSILIKQGENGVRVLQEATVETLVRKLIFDSDPSFEDVFFFSYKDFSSPVEVAKKIVSKCKGTEEDGFDSNIERKVKLLLKIVDTSHRELSNDMFIQISDLQPVIAKHDKNLSVILRDTMINHMLGENENNKVEKKEIPITPPPIYPTDWNDFSLSDLSYIELSRQLTLYDDILVKRMNLSEFLNLKKGSGYPSIQTIIDRGEQLQKYVKWSILTEKAVPPSKIFSLWVRVAYTLCFEMNNFLSGVNIAEALQDDSFIEKKFHPNKHQKQMNEIFRLANSENDKELKKRISQSSMPLIPNIDMIIDSINEEARYSDQGAGEERVVYFHQYQQIFDKIGIVINAQDAIHPYERVDIIQTFIDSEISAAKDVKFTVENPKFLLHVTYGDEEYSIQMNKPGTLESLKNLIQDETNLDFKHFKMRGIILRENHIPLLRTNDTIKGVL
eukprot:TRINITY_DN1623_c0_g1_i2.p1 TRINITY_DN1623_c0_g1~~TRINITY_DN1623_c0_g1_i2.p1  ORF type:complete len:465 (-),score=74.37 TRINITY_DN1623_c0_g1_i2:44-1438(-)